MTLWGLRKLSKKWVPVGSPFWYPFFFSKRFAQRICSPSSVRPLRWHVVHQNILLKKYKAIYIPVPKVACSTLKRLCAELLELTIPTHDVAEEIHLVQFPCANRYRIHDNYKDYFKFAFVRNPWARLVSCYNDKINYEPGHIYDRYENPFIGYLKKMKVYSENLSFDQFVKIVCDIPDEMAEAHFRSQYLFITDASGREFTDFIGHLESLPKDFSFISERLGLTIPLPHIRSGRPASYRNFYSNRTIQMVAKRYERDIEMFGYRF